MTNLSQNKFAEKYNIPAGTIKNWEQEIRVCPEYVLELLEYKVKQDNLSSKQKFDMLLKDSMEEEFISYVKDKVADCY
ncbi:MAG: hypothetical protein Q4F97_12820 [Bacteroidales bacterium]|nr:hypothetical protein [Bacteroidales bacterium]